MTINEAIAFLMRVHYRHFMANPRFWYDPALQAADKYVVVAASDLRLTQAQISPKLVRNGDSELTNPQK